MINDRNFTSHAYDIELADQIYQNVKNRYCKALAEGFKRVKQELEKVA